MVATDKAGLSVSDEFRIVVNATGVLSAASSSPAAKLSLDESAQPLAKNLMLRTRQDSDQQGASPLQSNPPSGDMASSTNPDEAVALASMDDVSASQAQWMQLTDMMAEMSRSKQQRPSMTDTIATDFNTMRIGLPTGGDQGLYDDSAARIDSQIHQLINAMATFAPEPAGQTHLASKPQPVLLQAELAANWR